MKPFLIAVCLALTVAACATEHPYSNTSALTTPKKPGCVPGSIPSPDDCKYFGAVYSRQEINRTGATTTAEALRLLDPTVQIR